MMGLGQVLTPIIRQSNRGYGSPYKGHRQLDSDYPPSNPPAPNPASTPMWSAAKSAISLASVSPWAPHAGVGNAGGDPPPPRNEASAGMFWSYTTEGDFHLVGSEGPQPKCKPGPNREAPSPASRPPWVLMPAAVATRREPPAGSSQSRHLPVQSRPALPLSQYRISGRKYITGPARNNQNVTASRVLAYPVLPVPVPRASAGGGTGFGREARFSLILKSPDVPARSRVIPSQHPVFPTAGTSSAPRYTPCKLPVRQFLNLHREHTPPSTSRSPANRAP